MPIKDQEKRREYNRKWRETHKELHYKLILAWRKRMSNWKEYRREVDKRYREKHAEEIRERKKMYYADPKIKARRNAKNAEYKQTFAYDSEAWAKWRAKWRKIYAKRKVRRGLAYCPCYRLRIPDYAVKGQVLDVHSAWLMENATDAQIAYAKELAKERWRK